MKKWTKKSISPPLLITMILMFAVNPALAGCQKTIPPPEHETGFMDEKYQEGYAAGKQFCRENPPACGVTDHPPARRRAARSEQGATIDPDFRITIPWAMFNGVPYELALDYYNNPRDPAGFYWKLDPTTLKASAPGSDSNSEIRVPAEWEPHAATWMQWPNQYESAMRPAFADIIDVVQDYEPVHLLTGSSSEETEARRFLATQGVPDTNVTWHVVLVDNAWLRDNGPIYVTDGADAWIQNWKFDAWGGNFGEDVGYRNDNRVPVQIAEYLGMTVEDHQDYVLEKGNLEFNGAGVLAVNWDCQDNRNPGMTKAEHEAILKEAFGVTRIIWAYGHDPEDATTGHIDGIARFINSDAIVVVDYGSESDTNFAAACEQAGLEVLRYPGDPNWLVGNGFVAAMGDGGAADAALKSRIETFFPGRDVHMIDARTIAAAGGGIHCVTNDQPAA